VKWVPWALSVALAALAARSASAAIVNVQFHGTIDTVLHPELLAGSDIGIGTLFSGDVFVDSDGASVVPAGTAYPGSPAIVVEGPGLTSLVEVDAEIGIGHGDPPVFPSYSSSYGLLYTGAAPSGSLFNDPGDWIWFPETLPIGSSPSGDRFAITVGFVDKSSTRTLGDDVAQEITSFAGWDAAYFFVTYNPGHTPGTAPQDTSVLAYGMLLPGGGTLHVPEPSALALVAAGALLAVGRLRRRA
jgi:PEP-CTERM motif-containing protein